MIAGYPRLPRWLSTGRRRSGRRVRPPIHANRAPSPSGTPNRPPPPNFSRPGVAGRIRGKRGAATNDAARSRDAQRVPRDSLAVRRRRRASTKRAGRSGPTGLGVAGIRRALRGGRANCANALGRSLPAGGLRECAAPFVFRARIPRTRPAVRCRRADCANPPRRSLRPRESCEPAAPSRAGRRVAHRRRAARFAGESLTTPRRRTVPDRDSPGRAAPQRAAARIHVRVRAPSGGYGSSRTTTRGCPAPRRVATKVR